MQCNGLVYIRDLTFLLDEPIAQRECKVVQGISSASISYGMAFQLFPILSDQVVQVHLCSVDSRSTPPQFVEV